MTAAPASSGSPRFRRRVVLSALVLLTLGVLIMVLATAQRALIYFPDTTTPPSAAAVLSGGQDVTLSTEDGLELTAWFAPPTGPEVGYAVLLAPGNGGNRAGRAGLARELTDRGMAVLLLDYRGYGGNPGRPSEGGLAKDADAAVAALTDLGFPPERVVYLGESLGTGVVASLATRHLPAGLVLRSPFTELTDVAATHYPWLPVRTLLRDRFPVLEPVSDLQVPVSVIHGDADQIVPSGLSHRVARSVPNLVEELVLPGVGHNDPEMFGAPVADVVRRLVDHLQS